MKKILVTGGCGYIGNVLVDRLLMYGYGNNIEVTVVDNLLHRQNCLTEYCSNKYFNFIYGDVRDKNLIKNIIGKFDFIIPLAAYVGMPACKKWPTETIQVNYESIKYLTEITSKNQYIIYPTTNSGYGLGQHKKNGKPVYCDENTPLNPISLYGETKCNAEKAVLDSGNGVTLRLATSFGISKRMRLDLLVNDFTYRAVTDKFIVLFESHFKRNFIHVKDISNTIIHVMANIDTMLNNAYNVGLSDANLSKKELCEKIKNYIPDFCIMESEINEDPDKRNYIVSNSKLESTGWKPTISLDDGIEELIKAYNIIKRCNVSFTNL